MTFQEIVNEVLFDRFAETRRASVERYVNSRYGRVWAQEPWTFKRIAVSTSMSDSDVTLEELGLQRIEGVWQTRGNYNYDMFPNRPEDFFFWVSEVGGVPYNYTVYGDTLHLERSPSSTTDFVVLGEKKFVPLEDDGDVPLIPEEFHMMLVHGAASEGLRMENDPTWQGFEQDYQAYLQDMKLSYLTAVRNFGDAYPAWTPSRWGV